MGTRPPGRLVTIWSEQGPRRELFGSAERSLPRGPGLCVYTTRRFMRENAVLFAEGPERLEPSLSVRTGAGF